MYSIILATALLAGCPDGSLLFVEGGSRFVENETDSPYTHVAIIFNIDNEPWVFEADEPRVRKVPLSAYVREVERLNVKNSRQMKLWLMKPKIPYNRTEVRKMRIYLKNQMNRKYSIWSYIQGKVGKGIHCGELTSRALLRGGFILGGNCCRQFPGGILYKAQRKYESKERIIHYVKDEAKPVVFTKRCENNACWIWIQRTSQAACKKSRVLCPWR